MNRLIKLLLAGIFCASILFSSTSCSNMNNNDKQKRLFQKEIGGKKITLFSLENSNGIKVNLTNYGGKIVNIWLPDRNGNQADIILGFNTIDEYLKGAIQKRKTKIQSYNFF